MALTAGLTVGLGFVNADLMLFALSVAVHPSGLLSASPWYYPIPRLLWLLALVFYAAFERLPRSLRVAGAAGYIAYWLGWLVRDLTTIDQPLEVWVMWVGYIPLAALSALLLWASTRPNTPLERTGCAGRSAPIR